MVYDAYLYLLVSHNLLIRKASGRLIMSSNIEINVAIICGCMPAFASLLRHRASPFTSYFSDVRNKFNNIRLEMVSKSSSITRSETHPPFLFPEASANMNMIGMAHSKNSSIDSRNRREDIELGNVKSIRGFITKSDR